MKKTTPEHPKEVLDKVEALKRKHKLDHVTILHSEGRYAYLKKPTRPVLKMVLSTADDRITQGEILLDNCWLDGDEVFKTDDDVFMGSLAHVRGLIPYAQVEVEKL